MLRGVLGADMSFKLMENFITLETSFQIIKHTHTHTPHPPKNDCFRNLKAKFFSFLFFKLFWPMF